MASHFDCIGIRVGSSDELSSLLSRLFERVEWTSTADGGEHASWSDASGAIVTANADANGAVTCVIPSFAASSRISARALAIVGDPDCSFCDLLQVEVLDEDGGMVYPLALQIDDLATSRGRFERGHPLTLRVAAFAESVQFWPDDAAYHGSQTGEVKFAAESYFPADILGSGPQPRAMLTGHVLTSEERVNGATRLPFWWLRVKTLGATYDVVAAPEGQGHLPASGSVIQGTFWIVGRVLDGLEAELR